MKYKIYDQIITKNGAHPGIILSADDRAGRLHYYVSLQDDPLGHGRWLAEDDLIPNDPHIRGGMRIYGPLDTEAAKELIGKEVYFGWVVEDVIFKRCYEKLMEIDAVSLSYISSNDDYNLIGVPLEEENQPPEPKVRLFLTQKIDELIVSETEIKGD